ncbi:MAG: AMP-binding protein, partial [Gemmatimonadetes bacterium]|nr:AMP-binding protein [Gemmatimonadota bacterium]MYK65705.1 AMP-binding protein [Gemmatimonadota bacterium]
PSTPALLIYTSGTTGRPKGALTTHHNLTAQITTLTAAWGWTASDRILHTLPLHHIHGLVNALACALWSGAACEFGSGAPASTWDRLASGEITLFMSVPTVYTRLIRAWEAALPATRRRWSGGAARLRLMVSGSAALPVATMDRWREVTGHTLLERYGMTEIGMALSNPLEGERRPGHVGPPLPGVEVRIVDDEGHPVPRGEHGEIEVRGPQVFRKYWGRPVETAAAFREGWFRTGDEGCVGEGGYYRILGRRSVDIVKTGGYKVSALEVEELYRTHPAVQDLVVVGMPHDEWGELLCAAWIPSAGHADIPAGDLRAWGKERLAPYKVPHLFRAVPELPRNAMGKVQKTRVRRMLVE